MRVVSLLASGTEIVCTLGAGQQLVGRSHECDTPEWVRTLPVCTGPTFDTTVSSGEIDATVRALLKSGQPLYWVDDDRIRGLEPDFVITQRHCAVCAVTPEDIGRRGAKCPQEVLALAAGTVVGIFEGVHQIAQALHLEDAGHQLVDALAARIRGVSERVRGREQPTVAVLEWTDPLFTSGNWVPELVQAAGGRPLFATAGHHSTTVAWEDVVAADPDHLIVAPCGFDLERTLREVSAFERRPGWRELRAVRMGRVAFADGNRYFNRSGPSIAETTEILAEILHGALTETPRLDRAWRRY